MQVDKLSTAISEVLEEYSDEVTEKVKKVIDIVCIICYYILEKNDSNT